MFLLLAPDTKQRWMAYVNCPNTEGNILIGYIGDLEYGPVWILNDQKSLGGKWSSFQIGSEIRKPTF